MSLKRLSDVAVGSHIKIGGSVYKYTQAFDASTGQFTLVQKRVAPALYKNAEHLSDVAASFRNAENFLVEVVEDAPQPAQSLTEQLRSQVEAAPTESATATAPSALSQADLADVKKVALSASLKAQMAQTKSVVAVAKAATAQTTSSFVAQQFSKVESNISELADELDALDGISSRHEGEIERLEDTVEAIQDEQEEHESRISYLERKHQEEEEKLNIQRMLDQKLGQQKAQADLQAQFDQKTKTTGGNKMSNLLAGIKNQFGKVEGKFAFSLATGGLAIRKGITQEFVAFNKETATITDVTGLTLDFNVPAFKLPTAVGQVKKGDIVLNGADFGYVTRVHDDFVEVIIPEKNVNGSVRPTTNAVLGAAFYTVVQTLDAAGQGGFNPMLLMALNKGEDKKDLLPLLLMSGGLGGQAGAQGGIDPMMMMLLGDKVDDLLPLILMQQGGAIGGAQGGIQGILPFLLMNDKKDGKANDLLPLMLMGGLNGQAGAQAGGINPMMLLAMGDGDIDPMTLMMMSGGFGGQGGGIFGQAPAAPKADVKADKKEGK